MSETNKNKPLEALLRRKAKLREVKNEKKKITLNDGVELIFDTPSDDLLCAYAEEYAKIESAKPRLDFFKRVIYDNCAMLRSEEVAEEVGENAMPESVVSSFLSVQEIIEIGMELVEIDKSADYKSEAIKN